MLIPGDITDGGFMEASYNGLLVIEEEVRRRDDLHRPGQARAGVARGRAARARRGHARHDHRPWRTELAGGRGSGEIYKVPQEESAWLAGAASGLLTETGTVGHISGIRVPPASRAAAGSITA